MAVNGILKSFCQKLKKNGNQEEYISGGTTIIHCAAGVSRSAAFCIAYLIKYRCMTMSNAYRHVAKCRPCINPNTGFISQLIEFEGKCREE